MGNEVQGGGTTGSVDGGREGILEGTEFWRLLAWLLVVQSLVGSWLLIVVSLVVIGCGFGLGLSALDYILSFALI